MIEKERTKRPLTQMNLLLRTIIGLYLLYLVYLLRNEFGNIPFTIAMAVFLTAAGVLIVDSVKRILKGQYDIPGAQEEEPDTQEEA